MANWGGGLGQGIQLGLARRQQMEAERQNDWSRNRSEYVDRLETDPIWMAAKALIAAYPEGALDLAEAMELARRGARSPLQPLDPRGSEWLNRDGKLRPNAPGQEMPPTAPTSALRQGMVELNLDGTVKGPGAAPGASGAPAQPTLEAALEKRTAAPQPSPAAPPGAAPAPAAAPPQDLLRFGGARALMDAPAAPPPALATAADTRSRLAARQPAAAVPPAPEVGPSGSPMAPVPWAAGYEPPPSEIPAGYMPFGASASGEQYVPENEQEHAFGRGIESVIGEKRRQEGIKEDAFRRGLARRGAGGRALAPEKRYTKNLEEDHQKLTALTRALNSQSDEIVTVDSTGKLVTRMMTEAELKNREALNAQMRREVKQLARAVAAGYRQAALPGVDPMHILAGVLEPPEFALAARDLDYSDAEITRGLRQFFSR